MRNSDLLAYKNKNKDLMMAVISFIDHDAHKTFSSQHNYMFQLQKIFAFHIFLQLILKAILKTHEVH